MIVEENKTTEYKGVEYPSFHGSPFDRGSADSYYGRPQNPHWYPEGTYKGERVDSKDMSMAELRAYYRGYEYNEEMGDKKEWR